MKIDQTYDHNCLIVPDLSRDPTYGETLYDTFGPRIVGVQIGALAMARLAGAARQKWRCASL